MYIDQEKQYSFDSGWFEVPQLDENHQLFKITHTIDWDSLLQKLSKLKIIQIAILLPHILRD